MKPALLIVLTLITFSGKSQYSYNVNAVQSVDKCTRQQLTTTINDQRGSIWHQNQLNLNNSFDFLFKVQLSETANDGGADGMTFVLQNNGLTAIGIGGGGMGYHNMPGQSLGIELDTWQNGPSCTNERGDIAQDHIAIIKNGDNFHCGGPNSLVSPIAVGLGGNIEDGVPHDFRVRWNALTRTIEVYFDGALIISRVEDMVNTIFGGNPMVWWGFTGSTGGATNKQWFETELDANIATSLADKCEGAASSYNMGTSVSFFPIAKFYWTFDDGSPIDSVNSIVNHVYSAGWHTTKLRIRDINGCEDSTTHTEFIHPKPTAWFTWNGVCANNSITFADSSYFSVPDNPPGSPPASYWWGMPNGTNPTGQTTSYIFPAPGPYTIYHISTSAFGCVSDTQRRTINIIASPVADFTFNNNACEDSVVQFQDNSTGASNWQWDFGDTQTGNSQNPTHIYANPGPYFVTLNLNQNIPGCSATVTKPITIKAKPEAYFKNGVICQQAAVPFTDSSWASDASPITNWWWDLGNGQFSNLQNPFAFFNNAGPITVKLVASSNFCRSDTFTRNLTVEPKPDAKFGYNQPVCESKPVIFTDSSTVATGSLVSWNWLANGALFSTQANPQQAFTVGNQSVELQVVSDKGCRDSVAALITVMPKPRLTANFTDACRYTPINFSANIINGVPVSSFTWSFGDGTIQTGQNLQHAYNANGIYPISVFAVSNMGCYSDTIPGTVNIYSTNAFAGNDTIAAAGQPVQLNASGGVSYEWISGQGLNNYFVANPVAVLSQTTQFIVKAFTPQGCISYDTVIVKIYKGPDIYLPNAFTPNGDGLNDILRGIPVGLKSFNYLQVYNRWGQKVFETTDFRQGWNGEWLGKKQETGVYIVLASAVDFTGKPIFKKQTVTLIR